MPSFTIRPRGPFSLAASAEFLGGFTPDAGMANRDARHLRMAFPSDRTFDPVAVSIHESDGAIAGSFVGDADASVVEKQVARILSIDHDGTGYPDVGIRDPAIGRIQAEHPGFRPVCFHSPYEAAAWAIITVRTPMRLAARVKASLAEQHGTALEIDGQTLRAFPSPSKLLRVKTFPGLTPEKVSRLHGIARATIEGLLDAEALRAMTREHALERLEALRGVGAWTSAHIWLRGAGIVDATAFGEPRVRAGAALAYGLEGDPDVAMLESRAEAWRPYRTWVCVLLAFHLGRSGKWNDAKGWRGRAPRSAKRAATTGDLFARKAGRAK